MGLPATGQMRAGRTLGAGGFHPVEVGTPGRLAAGDDTVGDAVNRGMQGHVSSFRVISRQRRPSRCISISASSGPELPGS